MKKQYCLKTSHQFLCLTYKFDCKKIIINCYIDVCIQIKLLHVALKWSCISFTDNGHRPDLINIDEGSLHGSKPRPKPVVTIDRDDDEDGDDADVIDGSGSGSSEVKPETTTLHPTQYPGCYLSLSISLSLSSGSMLLVYSHTIEYTCRLIDC